MEESILFDFNFLDFTSAVFNVQGSADGPPSGDGRANGRNEPSPSNHQVSEE
jgi:hypothetical protein